MKNVIIIPGLGIDKRKKRDFQKMIDYLSKYFNVYFFNWSSESKFNEIINELKDFIRRNNINKPNFVTHSFGAIILRLFLNRFNTKKERIVQTAPINSGAKILQKMSEYKLIKKTRIGSVVEDFLENKQEIFKMKFKGEIGIIAGTKRFHFFNPDSYLLPFFVNNKGSDSKVFLEETKLINSRDFIKLNLAHRELVSSPEVFEQIKSFIINGKFSRK